LIHKDKEITLNKEAEEAALFYAKFLNTEYIKNSRFNKNFFKDFSKLLDKDLNINSLDELNFKNFENYLIKEKDEKLNLSKDEKELIKNEQKKKEENFLFAEIDGKKQPVGNFRIEPPGLFMGRGCHPLAGRIKKRIYPEDITINIGKGEKIPETGFKDRMWKEVIHDNTVIWLASWKEKITDKMKYVRLSDKSDFKSKSDKDKFDLARKLKKNLSDIRKINNDNLINNDIKIKQLATALFFIENLALRVGNEKGSDEADTVGVSSLRVEHIELLPNNIIKLDFLGKDSVGYTKKMEIIYSVYQNLELFINGKNKKDDLFDKITPVDINGYLQNMMKGLTSKVFRTMNASKLFQKELNKITSKFEKYEEADKINFLLDEFNKANAKIALLCNHQKNINKNFKEGIDKYNTKIKEYKKKKKLLEEKKIEYKSKGKDTKKIKEQINKLESKIKLAKSKKELKMDLKNVSLSTSKVNYIDPRIIVAFCKKHNIDIKNVYTSALQDKFGWAMEVDENFSF
jgi:DNA topoisomerase-1